MYDQENFTEDSYREIIRLAKSKYQFIGYDQYQSEGKNILWRHDMDFSVHRALKLATIEAREGVKSTYFILLHSESYNALELEVAKRIYKIIKLGHDIGIHFDPSFYFESNAENNKLVYYLNMEKDLLEKIFEKKISVFSFHNPDVGNWLDCNQDVIAGMINTYSLYFRNNYGYCSDSNGYWRFRKLGDMLSEAKEEKLQVLTHPEWWVPQVMEPRDRITRCIDGRAKNQHVWYDTVLKEMGRENITSSKK